MDYRFGKSHYMIEVENPEGIIGGIRQILLDGTPMPDNQIPINEDGQIHAVRVLMGTTNN